MADDQELSPMVNRDADGNPTRMGRPRKPIDFAEMDKLLYIQCTLEEIAGWFECCEDTIEIRVKEAFGITFSEYSRQKRQAGRISLRRTIYQHAKRNPAACIFLCKNWLGMSDRQEISGPGGIPLDLGRVEIVPVMPDAAKLPARAREALDNGRARDS